MSPQSGIKQANFEGSNRRMGGRSGRVGRFPQLSSFPDVQLHIVDARSVGNCRPEAQARNPYSRSWLWIPGSLASLAPRNDEAKSRPN